MVDKAEEDEGCKIKFTTYKRKWRYRTFKVSKKWSIGLTYPFIYPIDMEIYPIVFGKDYYISDNCELRDNDSYTWKDSVLLLFSRKNRRKEIK